MKTNRSNKLFDQTRIATLGLQDLLAFGQLQPDGTYKVRNVTNSNFLNAIVISEQITYAEILALATASELVAGKNYTITNAVSGTLSLYIFAVSTSKLAEYGYDTTTGQVYSYDLATDTATNADNTGYINFTPQTAPAYQRGRVWYDSTTETLSVYDDISGTSVQLGQEEILRARNSTGSTILNGEVVYVSGAQGQNPRVSLALANAESTSRVIGVATHNISNNSVGKITTFGIVSDLNTSAYNEGDVLYLSASVAGGLTTTRPSAPNQAVMVGTVIHAAVNDGKILVHTDNYGVGFGTANQVRGMNAAGTAEEYKTIQGTASEVEVLHAANTVTIGLPNAVTISGAMTAGSFVKSGGVSAQFLKADGTVDANAYFYTNAQVTGQALTGLSVSGSAVVSTDSILTGIGKLQNQINAVLGSVNFQGVWNASTNTPTLTSSVGTKGYYYIVTVAGSTNLNGITDWKLGDWAIYDGSAWQKVDNTDAVVSVNGYTGIVTLAAADVGALPTSAISGTTGRLAKFTSSGVIGDSIVGEALERVRIFGTKDLYFEANQAAVVGLLAGSSISAEGNFSIYTADGVAGEEINIAYWNGTTYRNAFSVASVASGLSVLSLMENGGSVGIGTTSPSYKLDVNGDINSGGTLYTNLFNFRSNDVKTNAATVGRFSTLTGGSSDFELTFTRSAIGAGAYYAIQSVEQNVGFRDLVLQPNGGSVGIGTTTPSTKLHINFAGQGLLVSNDSGNRRLYLGTDSSGEPSIQATLSNGTVRQLNLNSDGGNVLIGTVVDNGVNKLQINGSFKANASSTIITSNGNVLDFGLSGSPIITLYQNSTLYGYYNNTSGLTNFSINNSTGAATFSSSVTAGGATITSGNNITMTQGDIQFSSNSGYGILSADSSRLIAIQNGTMTVTGNTIINNASSIFAIVTPTADAQQIRMRMSSNNGIIDVTRNGGTAPNLIFGTEGTERMRIKDSGVINIASIPTSSAGLSAGDIWSDGGTLKIV